VFILIKKLELLESLLGIQGQLDFDFFVSWPICSC